MISDLRTRLKSGTVAVGTWCFLTAEPDCVAVLSGANIDFVYLDVLNSGWSTTQVRSWCQAVSAQGAVPIVRAADPNTITLCLNAGAGGILVPDVDTAEYARQLVKLVRTEPLGQRDMPPRMVAVGTSETDPLLCIQLEQVTACEQMDEILSVPGIDVAVIGQRDLLADLKKNGYRGGSKAVDRWALKLIQTANRSGVVPGLMQPDVARARRWYGHGMRWLPISSDISILRAASQRLGAAKDELSEMFERTER